MIKKQSSKTAVESLPHYSGDVLFPWKLHEMLDDAETQGFTTVVSWQSKSAFKVHDKETFVSLIMPRYFGQTKYKSFQRQLNMWGFHRHQTSDSLKGAYSHNCFVRGQPSLCCQMTRLKKNKPMDKKKSMSKKTRRSSKPALSTKRSEQKNVVRTATVPPTTISSGPSVLDVVPSMITIPLHHHTPESSTTTSGASVVSHHEEDTMTLDEGTEYQDFECQEPDILLTKSHSRSYDNTITGKNFLGVAQKEEEDVQVEEFEGMRFFAIPDVDESILI